MKFKTVLQQELLNYGIKNLFGVPGRECEKIFFDEVEGINYITTRVEFTAGIAADTAGMMTRKPQVCFATMGPGATNLTTAIASAKLNKSPVLFITSQLESYDILYNYTHQCVDQAAIFKPITKWSCQLAKAEEIVNILERAIDICMTEPLGPVHIAIPVDFYDKDITYNAKPSVKEITVQIPTINVEDDIIKQVSADICEAKNPLFIIGQEVVRTNATDTVRKYILNNNIPFISTANAKGILPFSHELNYGSASCYMEGILHYDALEAIFGEVDLIVTIGYQYVDDLLPKMWERGIEKKLISISTVGTEEIRSKFKPTYEVIGNISEIFEKLNNKECVKKSCHVNVSVKNRYDEIFEKVQSNSSLTLAAVMKVINNNLRDGILVTDIGYYRHHAILFSMPKETDSFFSDTGLSSFGTGLPSAIGINVINRKKSVFLICGDGGFHASSSDLATLVKYNLPIVVIVLNNSWYKLIDNYQRRGGGLNEMVTKLSNVDFKKLAEANGCVGDRASTYEELNAIIKNRDVSKPLVVDVVFKYDDDFLISF